MRSDLAVVFILLATIVVVISSRSQRGWSILTGRVLAIGSTALHHLLVLLHLLRLAMVVVLFERSKAKLGLGDERHLSQDWELSVVALRRNTTRHLIWVRLLIWLELHVVAVLIGSELCLLVEVLRVDVLLSCVAELWTPLVLLNSILASCTHGRFGRQHAEDALAGGVITAGLTLALWLRLLLLLLLRVHGGLSIVQVLLRARLTWWTAISLPADALGCQVGCSLHCLGWFLLRLAASVKLSIRQCLELASERWETLKAIAHSIEVIVISALGLAKSTKEGCSIHLVCPRSLPLVLRACVHACREAEGRHIALTEIVLLLATRLLEVLLLGL